MPNDAPTDPVLAAALAKRAEASRIVAWWDEWIKQYHDLRTTLGTSVPGALGKSADNEARGSEAPDNPKRRTSPVLNQTADLATIVIERRGRPVPLGEMLSELGQMNFEIGGKDPKATLSARLSTSGRFVADREKGWWIKGRPLPGLTLPIEPEGEGLDAAQASSPSSPSAGLGNHEPPITQG